MARQAEHQTMTHMIDDCLRRGFVLGVDPGEAHCGIAALWMPVIDGHNSIFMETAVFDVRKRSHFDIMEMLNWRYITAAAMENFQIRPQGYNAFSGGRTLRSIGAFELQLQQWDLPGFFVNPGPDAELDLLPLSHLVGQARRVWGHGHHWQHARSAWRALGFVLAQSQMATQLLLDSSGIALSRANETKIILRENAIPDDSIAPTSFGTLD